MLTSDFQIMKMEFFLENEDKIINYWICIFIFLYNFSVDVKTSNIIAIMESDSAVCGIV